MSRLALTSEFIATLRSNLLKYKKETCAVLYGRAVEISGELARIVVRESDHPQPEAYSERSSVRVQLRPEFVAEVVQRARKNHESVVFVHTHPFSFNEFSAVDDAGEAELATFLNQRIPEIPHAALLVTPEASIARVIGTSKALRVVGVGENVVWGDKSTSSGVTERFDRQIRAFGLAGQKVLESIRVGIVGLGGTGSVVLQQLVHLGVCDFVLIDPDTVEETNLNRLIGATLPDVGESKVVVAESWAKRINPAAKIETRCDSTLKASVARSLADADFVFCCTDSHGSRAVLNQLAYQYLVPTIDTHALKLEKVLAKNSSTVQVEAYYSYDTGGRMSQARDNLASTYTADYGYVTDSPLVDTVTFKESSTTRLTTSKSYDYLNRLRSISSVASSESLPLSFSYAHNHANQRTRMTLVDGSYWVYEYDALGQVKSGKRYWPNGTPVPGQQFEYGHDTIGNRTSTLAGGDENGANLRSASYNANSKNQYTSRGVPAYIEVLGIAKVDATVTVEGSSSGVYRRGEYFRKELNVNNASAAQYPTIDVDTDVTSPVSGEKFLPLHPESFSHDTDGNLTQDGRWDYVWDGENRLVKLRSRSGSPVTERRVEFEYDWQGRRIRQTVWNDRDDGQGSEVSDTLYLYDGWNLIAELNANSSNAKVRTYIWGLDLSGTMQGAGGVGGLLMVIDHTGTTKRHYAAYDGNGNVMALADSTTGDWSARYEYGPFGEPIRANGNLAYANPIRWSTKYTDGESGLVYYGYRSYNPSTGRWLNRDPISELSDNNLYLAVRNTPIVLVDVDGRSIWTLPIPVPVPPPIILVPPIVSFPVGDCFRCGRKWYNPFTHCCVKSILQGKLKVFKRGEELNSGYSLCSAATLTTPKVDHYWIEWFGGSAGFYPNGDTDGNLPGQVQSPDPAAGRAGKRCSPIKLSPCSYDIEFFGQCVQSFIGRSQDNPPIYDTFMLRGENCVSWRASIIFGCMDAARVTPKTMPCSIY